MLLGLAFLLTFCACGSREQENTASGAETSGAVSASPGVVTPAATHEPVPLPDSSTLSETPALAHAPYQIGDRGDDINLLQNMLAKLGFDPGETDGVFGLHLKKAIENFQLYAGLETNGIADQHTIAALESRYNDALAVIYQAEQPLKGVVIGLDPGHQRTGNGGLEPVMPGSDQMKKKVSSGTAGRFTGVSEYVVNLQVGLKLKKALESLGAEVVMTREEHGVDISNADRARMMNTAKVDCWLRIHANGSDNPDMLGMFMLVPARGSMATDDPNVQEKSAVLADTLLKAALNSTGAVSLGVKFRSDQTGFGWSEVPVCTIEMGHMTNKTEDFRLVSESYQEKIVRGLTEGFVAYFQ